MTRETFILRFSCGTFHSIEGQEKAVGVALWHCGEGRDCYVERWSNGEIVADFRLGRESLELPKPDRAQRQSSTVSLKRPRTSEFFGVPV